MRILGQVMILTFLVVVAKAAEVSVDLMITGYASATTSTLPRTGHLGGRSTTELAQVAYQRALENSDKSKEDCLGQNGRIINSCQVSEIACTSRTEDHGAGMWAEFTDACNVEFKTQCVLEKKGLDYLVSKVKNISSRKCLAQDEQLKNYETYITGGHNINKLKQSFVCELPYDFFSDSKKQFHCAGLHRELTDYDIDQFENPNGYLKIYSVKSDAQYINDSGTKLEYTFKYIRIQHDNVVQTVGKARYYYASAIWTFYLEPIVEVPLP